MVFELLAAFIRAVFGSHRGGPDAPGYAPKNRIFRIHAVRKKEGKIWREVVDVHPAREIGFDERKAIGERKSQLRDRIGAGLGNVVTGYRHRIKVAHLVL